MLVRSLYGKDQRMSRKNIRTFTPLDAATWDALVTASDWRDGHWTVTMSNQQLGDALGTTRRLASGRAKRLIEFGMVQAQYSEVNGRPQAKLYTIDKDWLGKSPKVGDFYEVAS